MHLLAEQDPNLDVLAEHVRVALVRRLDIHAGHRRRRHVRNHLVPGQRSERLERPTGPVAALVLDRPAAQRVAGDANPVVVVVVLHDGVAELQSRRAAAGHVLRDPRPLADVQRQHRPALDQHRAVERHRHPDLLPGLVGLVRFGLGHHGHRLHRRHHAVHLVSLVRRHREEAAIRHVAHRVRDAAPGERVRGDAHAVVVRVPRLHLVAEHQGVRAAARRVRRRPGLAAHRKGHGRPTGHVHLFAELQLDLDVLAEHVGVAFARRQNLHAGHGRPLHVRDHLVPTLDAASVVAPVNGVAACILDAPPGQRVGRDADAVPVVVVVLDDVAEHQTRRSAAVRVGRSARVRADAERQHRPARHVHDAVELHHHLDHVARRVGPVVAGIRRDGHGRHHRNQAVHLAPAVRSHGVEATFGRVARRVRDAAAGQRPGPDAQPVVVDIPRLDPVAEQERGGAAAGSERRRPGPGTHRQRHGGLAGNMHFLAESEADLDVLPEQVRVALYRRPDHDVDHGGWFDVGTRRNAVAVVGTQAGKIPHGRIARKIRDRGTGE